MICKNCNQPFTIYSDDTKFYEKMGVPEPTWCPDCRQMRRLSWRDLIYLYSRQCDFSGRQILSTISPDKPYKIYDQSIWWSDKWDPLDYGQEFDFSRPFFEQYHELQLKVPRFNVYNKNSINSDYTNRSGNNKNCYLCFNIAECEDCYYCTNYILRNKECVDCYDLQKSELLYECFSARDCYNAKFLLYCRNCYDSAFLYDCHGCHDCFMSWNLRNAEYCIFNKKYSPEEYKQELAKIYPKTYQDWQKQRAEFSEKIKTSAVHKFTRIEKSSDCSGSQIENCHNVLDTYSAFESVNCRYCYDIGEMKECYDSYEPWGGELQYDCHGCNGGYKIIGCDTTWNLRESSYCELCYDSHDLFGCISLVKKQFCILNKQYTEEEYKEILPKVIEHLKKMGEWGEFFPMKLTHCAYNESVAQEYYPLTKEEVLTRGLWWKEEEAPIIDPDASQCINCGRNFKIIAQEKEFYQKNNLPEPEKCFKCRYADRLSLRDPRKLFERKCDSCGQTIKSIYSSDRPEKVYCEECYRKEIY